LAVDEIPQQRPLPWQAAAWTQFTRAVDAGRSPHAVLLAGSPGIGKMHLAEAMAARLLCEQPVPAGACGACRGCLLHQAGSHPDRLTVVPETEGSGILKIEAVRALTDFSQKTSQFNGYRAAVLAPAEALNRNAANALLKTLEEPPSGVILILVSHRPGRLPATIRSRCQLVRLGIPARATGLEWLATQGVSEPETLLDLAGGAPLAAVALEANEGVTRYWQLVDAVRRVAEGALSPVEAAREWQERGAREVTALMQRLTLELARAQAQGTADTPLARHHGPRDIHVLAQRFGELRRAAEQTLSRELSLEALFLLWRP